MKKLTAAIAALALYFSASAFGPISNNSINDVFNVANAKTVKAENVSRTITTAFNEKFQQATELTWKEKEGIVFGYFKQGNENLGVAYNTEGELIATSRETKFSHLPMVVQQGFKESFKDDKIVSNILEVELLGETNYYMTVEGKTSVKQIKIDSSGWTEVIKKTKKRVLVGSVS